MTDPKSTTSLRYDVEAACYKKAIDNVRNPARNHPIHDAVEKIEYGGGRFVVGVALDGVSQTKSEKRLVPISRMLGWDLARFCNEHAPEDLDPIIDWFRETTRDPSYDGHGATTVSLVRLDRQQGVVDGFNLGDSIPLMVVDRRPTLGLPGSGAERDPITGAVLSSQPAPQLGSGPESVSGIRPSPAPGIRRRAAVLAPLHSVANDPSSVYRCWRPGKSFNPDRFKIGVPEQFEAIYLVVMTDGFARISEKAARRTYNRRELEKTLAKRYPDFVRIYLPEALGHLAPGQDRPRHGRIRYSAVADDAELRRAVGEYYRKEAGEQERSELATVDLDTALLRSLMGSRQDPARGFMGRTVEDVLNGSHRTLTWLTDAPYNQNEEDRGIEQYLRQYLMAELFCEAMVTQVCDSRDEEDDREAESNLGSRLHAFGDGLGPIADDFAVTLIRVRPGRKEPQAGSSG